MALRWLAPVAVLACCLAVPAPTRAQYSPYGPAGIGGVGGIGGPLGGTNQPLLNPYLNLLRGTNRNGSRAANYFLGVVPEIDRRARAVQYGNAIQGLQQQVNAPAEPADEDPGDLFPEAGQSGHPIYFGNYGGYYNFPQAGQRQQRQQQQGRTGSAAPIRRR